MNKIQEIFQKNSVIAAVRNINDIREAVDSKCEVIFLMTGHIFNIKDTVEIVKEKNKRIFIHVDLIKGVAQDKEGIKYLGQVVKPDGIVTTKRQLISCAKNENMLAIHHIFMIDTHAYLNGIKSIHQNEPDAIEIMPGLMPRVVKDLSKQIDCPIIAGGLIKSQSEVNNIIEAGAVAASISDKSLWY